ncbi:hypothetical protein [Pseudomonas sp. FEN]|uniref:hypothetical protein n=1 Tax=Pseudomonas sp. FEN TaxID=2767468 RepID=UPI00174C7C3C|nr:hypothetical protein [Pseudomonas sp. FEN]
MNGKIVSLSVALLLAAGFNVQAANNAGKIRFSGEMVESTCDIGTQANGNLGASNRWIKVSPVLSLSVDTAANACREGRLPFSVSYQPLATNIAARQTSAQGVVIITYR